MVVHAHRVELDHHGRHRVLTFWVTGIVFVAVNLFLAWVVWRYRHREKQVATYDPENKKLEWWLTAVTSVGVAAMLAPGLFVWGKFVNVPKDAAIVEASRTAMALELPLPGRGQRARPQRRVARHAGQSVRARPG
jgi:cytochrome c oxidase subunit 2